MTITNEASRVTSHPLHSPKGKHDSEFLFIVSLIHIKVLLYIYVLIYKQGMKLEFFKCLCL